MRSATEERARRAAAAQASNLTAQEVLALLQMADDADHESGENCLTSLARVEEAAGYAPDPKHRSAGRARESLRKAGLIRRDFAVEGVGQIFTVCPVADWSGVVSKEAQRTKVGRTLAARLAAEHADAGTPEPHGAGASTPSCPLLGASSSSAGKSGSLVGSGFAAIAGCYGFPRRNPAAA